MKMNSRLLNRCDSSPYEGTGYNEFKATISKPKGGKKQRKKEGKICK